MAGFGIIKGGVKQEYNISGGGGGGHVIENQSGTEMAQEPTMQFKDAHITDDSLNEKTKVEVIKEVTASQFDNLPTDGSADGFYAISDGQGGNSINAEDVNYDNTTSGMSATNVQDAITQLNAEANNYYLIEETPTQAVKTIPYPSGYTIDNSMIVSAEYKASNSRSFNAYNVNASDFPMPYYHTNGITINASSVSSSYTKIVILLRKI